MKKAIALSLLFHFLAFSLIALGSSIEDVEPIHDKKVMTISLVEYVSEKKVSSLPIQKPEPQNKRGLKEVQEKTTKEKKAPQEPKISNISKFDKMLKGMSEKVKSPLPALKDSLVIKDEPKSSIVTPPTLEPIALLPKTAPEAAPEAAPEPEIQDEGLFMDPLITHQQELIELLKRQMRITNAMKGASCTLRLLLSRDGMIIEAEIISGKQALCDETIKASVRLGKLSPIDNDDVYHYLKDVEITIRTEADDVTS